MCKKFFVKSKKKRIVSVQEETERDEWDKERAEFWEMLKKRLSLDDPVGYEPKRYKP